MSPEQANKPGMPPIRAAEMQTQDLRRPLGPKATPDRAPGARYAVFGASALLLGFGGYEMYGVLSLGGTTPLEWAMLGLFLITFAWIALAAVSSVAGFIILRKRDRANSSKGPLRLEAKGRTAVLVPCYNENPASVATAIEAMVRELEQHGANSGFDWCLLSDTRDPQTALQEEEAVSLLRQRLGNSSRIYYRRRLVNTDRKSGNVAEFCRNWGSHYDYLLVLDADSLLSAEVIIELANRIDRDPNAGLIQTVPRLVGGTSLIARLQQFANAVYGPIIATGLARWAGSEGNFWGHNAIIRRQAFMECCGLPHLKGRAPFGGTILSHDFVEAALLRRCGWKVIIADDLEGSYEESPPSIVDLAVRDRRWCQGNLQHSKVIGSRGFHWVNRFHLLTGIFSYLCSPLWFALIVVGVMLALQAQYIRPEYFDSTLSLFPSWPRQDAPRAVRLFLLTMLVLLVPKILGIARVLMDPAQRRSLGGSARTLTSMLAEILLSAAIAPIMMCVHCGAVFSTLMGGDSGWNPQRRDDGSLPWKQLFYRHRWHTVIGILLTLIAWNNSPALLAWLSPAIFGLLLAAPLSALTSSLSIGRWFKGRQILATTEELNEPSILRTYRSLEPTIEAKLACIAPLATHFSDPALVRRHEALTPTYEGTPFSAEEALARVKIMDASNHRQALEWLSQKELDKVLLTPYLYRMMVSLAQNPRTQLEARTG
ncbi:glucans biosynthesis glucosyltransferase MdoH [Marinobacterium lutimaris]|uniref:Glucans biosynthesis glucosyltransferase H n=1 Tax=Marinobacterium lutimaris TaxID=568106 RepID=A0A1H6DGM0_9GAMM|nr:glucans biosynthesis glucosyltransferase MdoH [Marinobacterium lutimaris]SEG84389.1 membrane glycosyltransferase [Marinobacterium lutimaris]